MDFHGCHLGTIVSQVSAAGYLNHCLDILAVQDAHEKIFDGGLGTDLREYVLILTRKRNQLQLAEYKILNMFFNNMFHI